MTDGRPLAIVDIDGVVADVRHRLHHLDRRPKNWSAFFAAAVFQSFVYLIGNGAFEWGPAKAMRRNEAAVSASRTAGSTVRRVGLEGRPPAADESPGEAA